MLGVGLSERRLGRWQEALEALEYAYTLDPLSAEKAIEVGSSFHFARRYDEAMDVEVAGALRDLGWNTKYVGDLDLVGHSDEDVFARAWSDQVKVSNNLPVLTAPAKPGRKPRSVPLG